MSPSPPRPFTAPAADRPLAPEVRDHALGLLAQGELVAIPTETVYGIAARADLPAAVEKLRALKGQPDGRALTWHVGRATDALPYVRALAPLARRLAERYWPGPLTLVLSGRPPGVPLGPLGVQDQPTFGVRLPAHKATSDLLAAADFPVVATSANRHGEPPLVDASAVAKAFGERLALVLDGGPSRLAEASGVLRVVPGSFELLREGLLPTDDLRRTAGLRIAFVCTGNTCRSPMAEGIARSLLAERLGGGGGPAVLEAFGFEVLSMGVFASQGSPAASHAIEAMAEAGIDIADHRSRPALPERLRSLDLVLCLTEGHADALRHSLPPDAGGHIELLDPTGADIPDPIGGSRDDYRRCAMSIRAALEVRLDDWA